MHCRTGAALVALILFAGQSTVSLAQSTSGGGPTGTNSTAEGIGNTSSTHNPNPSWSSQTGMENRKATGSEMGTDTSTHNPAKENR
jgi:hypothetical protein